MRSDCYFAYGSNLNLADFERYCLAKSFPGGGLRPISTAILEGYELTFSHYSEARGGGALNLQPSERHSVGGVLFEVDSPQTWDVLDFKEGHPHRYQKTPLHVRTPCGGLAAAATYIVQHPQASYFCPTDDYVRIVAAGLQAFGLCSAALHSAAKGAATGAANAPASDTSGNLATVNRVCLG